MTDKLTDSITPPMPPTDLDPLPPDTLAGDWKDDDAQVYEGDFTAADHTAPSKPPPGVPHTVDELPVTTRLITRNGQVGTINGTVAEPLMLLPRDPKRKNLTILVYADTKLTCILGSAKSDCYNGTTLLTVNGGGVVAVTLDDHTGAVWAYSTAAAAVDITAIAVTQ